MNCYGLFSDQSEISILFHTDTMGLEPDHKASVTPFRLPGVDKIASNLSVWSKAKKPGDQKIAKTNQPRPEYSLSNS